MIDAVEQARAAAAAAQAAAEEARRLADEAARRAEELAAALHRAAEAAPAPAPDVSRVDEAAPTPAPDVSRVDEATASTDATASTGGSTVETGTAPPGRTVPDATTDATSAPDPTSVSAPTSTPDSAPVTPQAAGPLGPDAVEAIRTGYAVEGSALELGALVNGGPLPDVQVRIPLAMLNRHGLVAGATGTGKTRTLQLLAEQIAANGVPVFAADVKGDLSGLAEAGQPNAKLLARTEAIGQRWQGTGSQAEFYSLGGQGTGVPIRATVSGFGPLLLSKVLGLNATQESSLGLVFHYAERAGLPLVDLSDLRAVLTYLVSDQGKAELAELGGLSKQTAGVILRELVTFADKGADRFFGEPEIDTREFLRTAPDGRGIVSLLEVPGVQDQPEVFSTFLMWLLADLFNELPEVGDTDKPELVFFFDEAHLLFSGSSEDFREQIVRTVRLIRSKGVGIVFVTQTPKDVPDDVLAQLGSRVQHQLRAHTPDDAKALRATVSTYPTSDYDLGEVLTSLATGEAIVTVMNEDGAPTPVAWTRLRAPQGSMDALPSDVLEARVASSPLLARYGTAVDPESAREVLAARMESAAAEAAAAQAQAEAEQEAARAAAAAAKEAAAQAARDERERKAAQAEYERTQREFERAERAAAGRRSRSGSTRSSRSGGRAGDDPLGGLLGNGLGQTIAKEVVRGIFSTLRRRR
ncbi:ATPase [Curtobacterium sp. SGAir0471]|uniref:helicase HerA-like domain-containing protein n=1 Tax=Curtobacterium sp. SGAir0471 TaxID=2070337 RepID=UPI0010CD4296|nr:helicase HerA-like domain-containing protein [Curtobacterium sp. SGAir0471]QCR43978.1 ATPase [Curtobacterium sp. SGAir0471]